MLAFHLMKHCGSVQLLQSNEANLVRFLQKIESGYDPNNPYHNRSAAFACLQLNCQAGTVYTSCTPATAVVTHTVMLCMLLQHLCGSRSAGDPYDLFSCSTYWVPFPAIVDPSGIALLQMIMECVLLSHSCGISIANSHMILCCVLSQHLCVDGHAYDPYGGRVCSLLLHPCGSSAADDS